MPTGLPEVVLGGEFDLTAAPALAEMLTLALCATPRDIVLQMGDVAFIDCACARVIAQTAQALPRPGQLIIQGLSPVARSLFHLTGLDSVATVVEPAGSRP
jgi:anti-anti-sigma factor